MARKFYDSSSESQFKYTNRRLCCVVSMLTLKPTSGCILELEGGEYEGCFQAVLLHDSSAMRKGGEEKWHHEERLFSWQSCYQ